MLFHAYNDSVWLYPDTVIPGQTELYAADAARGGTVGVQLLTDVTLDDTAALHVVFDAPSAISCETFQLLPTRVEENSGRDTHTADRYEDVADFVTRRAPFEVYDVTRPLTDGMLRPGRLALFLLLRVDASVTKGDYLCVLTCKAGEHALTFPITLHVSACVIPPLCDARFGMVNWLFLEDVETMTGLDRRCDEFWALIGKYLDNQLDLRTNHLKLPSGVPIRDESGTVVDFDFADCERLGQLALDRGFSYIYGGFVARFQRWDDPDQFLLWDRNVSTSSIEGYRQLSIYFKKLRSIVASHGWQSQWMQCLVDEPQFPNSESYRALSGICRKHMPGVKIHDPVETTEIGGAVDIWCVKQAVYEKHLENFQRLQAMGEEMWVYTCGFPAGSTMNRSTDLPLLAGRLPMWMCVKYGMTGFLHWGYNAYAGRDPFTYNCFATAGKPLPPGDGFIVYPGDDGRPWNSVRAQLQRAGAEDAEALFQLPEDARMAFIDRVCSTFDDYNPDPANFERVRHELLASF
ncbi:MAG: DUF4091 domain-containing protein [Clostridiaceae bacterium]|nr:DUF4091 domain-containing protein [Clostridiaceae bacterium]